MNPAIVSAIKAFLQSCNGDISQLVLLGFTEKRDLFNCSIARIYWHRKWKIVVKRPYLGWGSAKRLREEGLGASFVPPCAVPTEVIRLPSEATRDRSEGELIYIQPFVSVTRTYQAMRAIIKTYEDSRVEVKVDMHQGNCGWFNRQPVLFDW